MLIRWLVIHRMLKGLKADDSSVYIQHHDIKQLFCVDEIVQFIDVRMRGNPSMERLKGLND